MAYEHKEGCGALFRNEKDGNSNKPDMKGNLMVNGSLMDLAAWFKTSKTGDEYMSVKLSERRTVSEDKGYQAETGAPRSTSPAPNNPFKDFGNDLTPEPEQNLEGLPF